MAKNSSKKYQNSPLLNRSIHLTKNMANMIHNSPPKNISITPIQPFPSPIPLSLVLATRENVVPNERDNLTDMQNIKH